MSLLTLPAIAALQDRATRMWHEDDAARLETTGELEAAILAQHRANYDLWHIEDQARTPGIDDATLARTKRAIDAVNQQRNDLAEQCDARLLALLAPLRLPHPQAELHSESPGLMIDRLSILSLKLFHTREEMARSDAPAGHVQRNQQRFGILLEQRDDLQKALETLWRRVLSTERSFKVYRQLKMYNDPALNPSVYGAAGGGRR